MIKTHPTPEVSIPACYVSALELERVKGITRAELSFAEVADQAPGWFILAGGNGSGKSTILRSLAAAAMAGEREMLQFVDDSWIQAENQEESTRQDSSQQASVRIVLSLCLADMQHTFQEGPLSLGVSRSVEPGFRPLVALDVRPGNG